MRMPILAALVAVAVSTPAIARDVGAKDRDVAPPSAKALALSRKYIALLGMEERMNTMMTSIMPALVNDPAAGLEDAGEDKRQAFADSVRESTVAIVPKMMDRMAVVYAETLNEKELQGLVDFYGSAIGTSVLAKSLALSPAATDIMTELMPQMKKDMMVRLCARISCDAKPVEVVTPTT